MLQKIFTEIQGIRSEVSDMKAQMNSRFDILETRMGNMEIRMDNIETRMGNMEIRMDNMETRMESLESKVDMIQDHSASNLEQLSSILNNQNQQRKVLESLSFRSLEQETDIRVLKRVET